MFGLFSKRNIKLLESGVLEGAVDIHCHILPGVDDGAANVQQSLKLLQYLEDVGFQEIWLTPHTMEEFQNTRESLLQSFDAFRQHYSGSISLNLSSEYMLDSAFCRNLETNNLIPLGKDQTHLLVETRYLYGPQNLQELLLAVYKKGYSPILAHPERYVYMDEDDYEDIKLKGYNFQLNLNSLSGYYGSDAQQNAHYLLEKGLYDFVGTDLHHLESYTQALKSIRLTKKELKALQELFENNKRLV